DRATVVSRVLEPQSIDQLVHLGSEEFGRVGCLRPQMAVHLERDEAVHPAPHAQRESQSGGRQFRELRSDVPGEFRGEIGPIDVGISRPASAIKVETSSSRVA
ncbi:hypothetical protein NLM24_27935, partial [Nocardia zapadnayensis]